MKKKLYLRFLWALCVSMLLISCGTDIREVHVVSPDGKVTIGLQLDAAESLKYNVVFNKDTVIYPSGLELVLAEGGSLHGNLSIRDVSESMVNETYTVYAGKSAQSRNQYRESLVVLREHGGQRRTLRIELRAYNDGAAFRYKVPSQRKLNDYDLVQEKTRFKLSSACELWPIELESFNNNYEEHYLKKSPEGITVSSLVGLPLVFRCRGNYAGAIAEADLTDYSGMYLSRDPGDHEALISVLSGHPNKKNRVVVSADSLVSPWRVVMIAEQEKDLISSDIITNLNDPCVIKDPSWIKPGKTAWDWWSGPVVKHPDIESGMNNETMKYYIDFASEYGLEYMLIDAGWYGKHRDGTADVTSTIREIDIKALVEYAGKKNVDILLWVNWEALNKQMSEAMALYERWGVKGIKVDYMDADHQEMVAYYHKVAENAAEHHLLVNFHGAYKPTGIRRTYPNLITREGVLGLEYLKWSDKADPEHNVTIPFTRMLAGPMDYTPGGFLQVPREEFVPRRTEPRVLGTRCHQLAMFVVYESPLQMVADHPDAYRGELGEEFIRKVPASWDETRALQGEIGEYLVLIRRKGKTWYLGAMTDWSPRSLDIDLEFLDAEKEYRAHIFSDAEESGKNPQRLNYLVKDTGHDERIKIEMAEGGGFAAWFEPLD